MSLFVFSVGGYAFILFLLNFFLDTGDVKNVSLLGTIRSNPTSCSSIMPLINFLSYTCLILPSLVTSGMRNTLRFFGILPFPAFIPSSFIHEDTKLLLSFFLAFRLLILAFFVIFFNNFSYFVIFIDLGFLGGECIVEVLAPPYVLGGAITGRSLGGDATTLCGQSCPRLGMGRMSVRPGCNSPVTLGGDRIGRSDVRLRCLLGDSDVG